MAKFTTICEVCGGKATNPIVTVLTTGRAVYTCGMVCAVEYEQTVGRDTIKTVIR